MQTRNIIESLPAPVTGEVFQDLLRGDQFRVERIVSTGQRTPAGEWYDQENHEWVILLTGGARLRFEGQSHETELRPGDSINIPAHLKHRVEWTDPDHTTVWLAVHYTAARTDDGDGGNDTIASGSLPV